MSNIQLFNFENEAVRILINEETQQTYFNAQDVCNILGLVKVESSLRKLNENQKLMLTVRASGQDRLLSFVTEAGLYRLTFASRKPEAERFTDWIVEEVIPSIRKTGSYSLAKESDGDVNAVASLLRKAASLLEQTEKDRQKLDIVLKSLAPTSSEGADTDVQEGVHSLGSIATMLGVGRNTLFSWLRDSNILHHNEYGENLPLHPFVESGWFILKQNIFTNPKTGEKATTYTTLVTGKGLRCLQLLHSKALVKQIGRASN